MRNSIIIAVACTLVMVITQPMRYAQAQSEWQVGAQVLVCPQSILFESAGTFMNAQTWFTDFGVVTVLADATVMDGERWWQVETTTADGVIRGYIHEPSAIHCPGFDTPTGLANPLLQAQLMPGDIIVARIELSDCPPRELWCHAYHLYDGYWLHSGIIVEHADGLAIVDASSADGVALTPLDAADLAGDVAIVRATVPKSVRHIAAENAKALVGAPFNYWYQNKNRTDAYYCSQLVWAAYAQVGIDLDSNFLLVDQRYIAQYAAFPPLLNFALAVAESGITPDDLVASTHTTIIYP